MQTHTAHRRLAAYIHTTYDAHTTRMRTTHTTRIEDTQSYRSASQRTRARALSLLLRGASATVVAYPQRLWLPKASAVSAAASACSHRRYSRCSVERERIALGAHCAADGAQPARTRVAHRMCADDRRLDAAVGRNRRAAVCVPHHASARIDSRNMRERARGSTT